MDHYFEVLQLAKETGYEIITLRGIKQMKDNSKFIALRHDIDVSLFYALELAKLEASREMHATYFILLHNDFYNVMSSQNSKIIRRIADMGHEIGLHLDTRFFNSKETILEQIDHEGKVLENITDMKVTSISQHFPKITPDMPSEVTSKYVYARDPLILEKLMYISDSGRNWRSRCMCNHIGKVDRLQILTHPLWWVATAKSRDLTLDRFKADAIRDTDLRVEKFREVVHEYVREQLHQC